MANIISKPYFYKSDKSVQFCVDNLLEIERNGIWQYSVRTNHLSHLPVSYKFNPSK